MTLFLNCKPPRDSMSQLTPSALSNRSGAIQYREAPLEQRSMVGFRPDVVVDCIPQSLSAAQIPFCRLDADMP
jgi:hypothetical protein